MSTPRRRALKVGVALLGGGLLGHKAVGSASRPDQVTLKGGRFQMGSESAYARPNERPMHWVQISPFSIDRTHVTNRAFGHFVRETGYVTTAERAPKWEELAPQLPPGTQRPPESALVAGGMVYVGKERPRIEQEYLRAWAFVPGANWRRPLGPQSGLNGLEDHPVVQVSYIDALAFAQWCGRALPTEAQFEFAARGGVKTNTPTSTFGPEILIALCNQFRASCAFLVIDSTKVCTDDVYGGTGLLQRSVVQP